MKKCGNLFLAVLAAASCLHAGTPEREAASRNSSTASQKDSQSGSQTDSQSSESKDSQKVQKEVRSLNGAMVTVERTKDPSGKEVIILRIPKGNGLDRVKTISEKEYRRLFPKTVPLIP